MLEEIHVDISKMLHLSLKLFVIKLLYYITKECMVTKVSLYRYIVTKSFRVVDLYGLKLAC